MIQRSIYKVQNDIALARMVLKPPYEVHPESLVGEIRILYVVRGKSILRTPTSTLHISEGDSILVSSGNIVNNWIEEEGFKTAEVILFRLVPALIERIFKNLSGLLADAEIKTTPTLPAYIYKTNDAIEKFIDGLQYYFDNPSLLREELIEAKIKEFLFLLMTLDNRKLIGSALKTMFNPVTHKFSEIIDAHIFENMPLEELAHLSGLSLSSFNRKFKQLYNESPKKYIVTKRLYKAKELLSQSELRISEIAFDCCFEDPANFSRSFSSLFGISPSDYRRSILT